MSYEFIIVIPCYNEEKRLDQKKIIDFLNSQKKVALCFVNDGSSDKTLEVLHKFEDAYPQNVVIVSTSSNVGKAGAVRTGILHCNARFKYKKIAYLDADLSTSLEECLEISENINEETLFAFGSRIKKIDTNIQRKTYRFLVGRVIATFISRQLNLGVYDTQCGCKIFRAELSKSIFQKKFISRWLFDVELFHRIILLYGLEKMSVISKEVPLKSWIDSDESKVKFTYFFKLWYDLYLIKKTYNTLKNNAV